MQLFSLLSTLGRPDLNAGLAVFGIFFFKFMTEREKMSVCY